MRPQTHYLIAALLLLATIPMYRYIFTHARETDYSPSTISRDAIAEPPSRAPVLSAQVGLLLAGEVCKDGTVYLASRNGYVRAQSSEGNVVHCQADHLVSANAAAGRDELDQAQSWYPYGQKLPDGYKCSAADGPVYRTRTEKGATVIEPLIRGGVIVRCGGDQRSSHR